jgi:predicted transcriptional regulator
MNHLKRLNINENSNFSPINEKFSYDYDHVFTRNSINFSFNISDEDKEIIRKIGDNEEVYTPLGLKNFFKRDTWLHDFDIMPKVTRLVELGLIDQDYHTRKLTKLGQEYYDYLYKK